MPHIPGLGQIEHSINLIHEIGHQLTEFDRPVDPNSAVLTSDRIDRLLGMLITHASDFRVLAYVELSRTDPFFDTLKGTPPRANEETPV